ncbi:MAG TPA: glycosyltransferase family 4 protein [Candidatus Krumholzibacteria bacterium]
MRIAMLSWEALHAPCVGGVGRHVSELALALGRRGHEVHIFTRVAHGQTYYEIIDGVHYHRCPYQPAADFVDDVNNMCRAFVDRVFVVEDMQGPFDVVHAHDWLAANAMIWIKQGRNRPGVFTMHSTEYARCGNAFPPGRSDRIRFQERAGTYWSERVICVSNALRAELAWMYEVPETKIDVIPNGVDPTRFQQPVNVAAARRRYDIGPTDPVVVFSGRLEWQKGPDFLLEAMPAILRAHARAKLVYVGDGSMRPGLENRAWQLGIGHAVRFLGRRDEAEIATIYQMCDTVCVPSRNEPFGIVILEAWCAGKPVIVTEHGGATEIVRHEQGGLHVSPTPISIAWGIGTIFSDFDRARRMGETGRGEALARYAWPAIAEKTAAVYERVAPETAAVKEAARRTPRKAARKAVQSNRTDGGEQAESVPSNEAQSAAPAKSRATPLV